MKRMTGMLVMLAVAGAALASANQTVYQVEQMVSLGKVPYGAREVLVSGQGNADATIGGTYQEWFPLETNVTVSKEILALLAEEVGLSADDVTYFDSSCTIDVPTGTPGCIWYQLGANAWQGDVVCYRVWEKMPGKELSRQSVILYQLASIEFSGTAT